MNEILYPKPTQPNLCCRNNGKLNGLGNLIKLKRLLTSMDSGVAQLSEAMEYFKLIIAEKLALDH